MYCPNCGTKNNYYHRFCFLCGTRLVEENDDEAAKIQDDIESTTDDSLQIDNIEGEEIEDFVEKNVYFEEKDDKEDKIGEDDFFSELSKPSFDFDLSYIDFQNDDSSEDFDEFNEQMPLRRYHRDSGKSSPQRLIKTGLVIFIFALVGLLAILIGKSLIGDDSSSKTGLDFRYEIEDIILEGEDGKKITFLSKNAQMITVSSDDLTQDKIDLPVTNGNAVLTLLNSDFLVQDYDIVDSQINVSLNILVKADDYDDKYEKIKLKVAVVYAPLSIIQPSGGETFIEGDTYQLVIKVNPNSEVFIDDNSYTHLIDDEGNLDVLLEVPDLSEVSYNIKVVTPGYEDNERTVKLKREMMDFPLMIDQEVPIVTTEEWVEISGITDPKAKLVASRDLREDPEIDAETGAFTIFVRATRSGYTPVTLTANIEGLEDSRLELVIDRVIDESTYTRSAWAPAYDELKAHENIHAGQAFMFIGTVKSMDSTGTKSVLMVDTSTDSNEKLIYVDYWGKDTFTIGQNVRIFGNRWGNRDELPLILAKYIYNN